MADARLAYAAARVRARHARRPGAPQWGALDASRTPEHYVAALRTSGWLHVPEADVAADPDGRERWLRQAWREACAEVAHWYPARWRDAVAWLATLPDLDLLETVRADEPPPDWATDDAEVQAARLAALGVTDGARESANASVPRAAPTTSLREAWRRGWYARLPADGTARRLVGELEAAVRRAATLPAGERRETLERVAERVLRRAGMGPAAGVAYLLLLALRLERVRGGLAARDVVVGCAA